MSAFGDSAQRLETPASAALTLLKNAGLTGIGLGVLGTCKPMFVDVALVQQATVAIQLDPHRLSGGRGGLIRTVCQEDPRQRRLVRSRRHAPKRCRFDRCFR